METTGAAPSRLSRTFDRTTEADGRKIGDVFPDGTELYRDPVNAAARLTADAGLSRKQVVKRNDAPRHNALTLATLRPSDRVESTYHGIPVHRQSMGQRTIPISRYW